MNEQRLDAEDVTERDLLLGSQPAFVKEPFALMLVPPGFRTGVCRVPVATTESVRQIWASSVPRPVSSSPKLQARTHLTQCARAEWLKDQREVIPLLTRDLSGRTILVVGANVGLGLEGEDAP